MEQISQYEREWEFRPAVTTALDFEIVEYENSQWQKHRPSRPRLLLYWSVGSLGHKKGSCVRE